MPNPYVFMYLNDLHRQTMSRSKSVLLDTENKI